MTENLLGKILFGVLFTVVLPFAAILWAIASETLIVLPPLHSDLAGLVLIVSGFLISPKDHDLICSGLAMDILIVSKF